MAGLNLFGFHVYGFLVGVGVLGGFWIAETMRVRFADERKSLRKIKVWDAFFWVLLPAVVGARLYHVFSEWEYYRVNPLIIPAIWTGGLGIYGAIIGGLIGLWVFTKKRGVYFFEFIDLAVFGLPIGQAIGRWGNYFNQELYGKPFVSNSSVKPFWAIYIKEENRLPGFEEYTHFHPLFLYELIWSLVTLAVMFFIWKRKGMNLKPGSYFSIYLMLYGLGRFFLEYFRIESWRIGGINVAQVISSLIVAIGFIFLVKRGSWQIT